MKFSKLHRILSPVKFVDREWFRIDPNQIKIKRIFSHACHVVILHSTKKLPEKLNICRNLLLYINFISQINWIWCLFHLTISHILHFNITACKTHTNFNDNRSVASVAEMGRQTGGPSGSNIQRYFYCVSLVIEFMLKYYRSQWPSGLRRGSASARLLEFRVRISRGSWLSLCNECCVLTGRGLCDGHVRRLEESYRVWFVRVRSRKLISDDYRAN